MILSLPHINFLKSAVNRKRKKEFTSGVGIYLHFLPPKKAEEEFMNM